MSLAVSLLSVEVGGQTLVHPNQLQGLSHHPCVCTSPSLYNMMYMLNKIMHTQGVGYNYISPVKVFLHLLTTFYHKYIVCIKYAVIFEL